MFRKKFNSEFRPDRQQWQWLKALYMTRQQRLKLAKWALYSVLCMLLLVVQDVVMSQVSLFGATTDLAACVILLIAVLEGSEVGGLFAIIASTLYYLSGSAPGAFVIASLTFLGIFTALLRQMFWRRNLTSILLCAGAAMICHEMITFMMGVSSGLTTFRRAAVFSMTGLLSWGAMLPLYPLIHAIGRIGGQQWKE